MRRIPAVAALALTLSGAVAAQPAAKPAALASAPREVKSEALAAAAIDKALAGSHRSESNRARDQYRHPKETLLFFGLRPDMTVVEITPGAGWYSEVIAPVLAGRGRYIAAHNNPQGSPNAQRQRAAFVDKLKSNPELYGPPAVTSFGKGFETNLAAPGSADMVLTFRNVHNWQMAGFAPEAFRAFHTALKPGGILGVVDHRLPEDREETEETRRSGYMKQSEVIRLAEAAGFRLVDSSEVNANPKDKADHPRGVWTLPPNFSLGDTDRAIYAAIGESDRMTLKFVKPGN